jgi:hypothetical protein
VDEAAAAEANRFLARRGASKVVALWCWLLLTCDNTTVRCCVLTRIGTSLQPCLHYTHACAHKE